MTQSRHTYLDVHTQTSVQLLGHAGAHIPGKHTPNDYLPCLQKQRLGCLCRCYWGRIGENKMSPGTLAGGFSKFHAFDWQHWTPKRKLECLNFRGKHKRTSRVEWLHRQRDRQVWLQIDGRKGILAAKAYNHKKICLAKNVESAAQTWHKIKCSIIQVSLLNQTAQEKHKTL